MLWDQALPAIDRAVRGRAVQPEQRGGGGVAGHDAARDRGGQRSVPDAGLSGAGRREAPPTGGAGAVGPHHQRRHGGQHRGAVGGAEPEVRRRRAAGGDPRGADAGGGAHSSRCRSGAASRARLVELDTWTLLNLDLDALAGLPAALATLGIEPEAATEALAGYCGAECRAGRVLPQLHAGHAGAAGAPGAGDRALFLAEGGHAARAGAECACWCSASTWMRGSTSSMSR